MTGMPPGESVLKMDRVLLVFDRNNRLLLRAPKGAEGFAPLLKQSEDGAADFAGYAEGALPFPLVGLARAYETACGLEVFFALADREAAAEDGLESWSIERLEASGRADPVLTRALSEIGPHLVAIPYLDLTENEYIYRFRTAKERNRDIYVDAQSDSLYQSALCSAIKAVRRIKEKSSGAAVELDFGAVSYVLPSHFGFCLGVQNAIERAYEAVAENPGKRVFMLSELIHNPFVNKDLRDRGLRYLQSDKGEPLDGNGQVVASRESPDALWNLITEDDAVIIPAFGATNEDKVRLIKRGVAVRAHDATCMLVEKVWKAARRYAREGYTVIIHGKAEHEETKATFSNSARFGPSLIIRNMDQARALGEVLSSNDPETRALFYQAFAGCYSEGFDVERDLERLAVVNQTTLLRNETLKIIDYLRQVVAIKFGEDAVEQHFWSKGKGDTLCYATQVNQDALVKALETPVDAALVVGGKNSSNTFQLFRMCEAHFGERAHYIQSEANLLDRSQVRHYVFPYEKADTEGDRYIERSFLPAKQPIRVLLTGGASCPDGIIQQVINRINGFFPAEALRPVEQVLEEITSMEVD